ncbi:dual adapter for phosphotyrosine and 3-phosphotyrosine and 3-phosphoinositide-like [Littorina saxatilis]|uniref:Dual adapter for phosphotyrosine and 3-phosphotyrosine and 3-phosphoinositide n=1 Tax=Littorina saxatilis TaxID=31220 RepID=A0AAN9BUP4_9CAEN
MSQQSGDIESLDWFHPNLTRHTAESILLQNGQDGTYLLRPSSKGGGEYALSVKFDNSVKHFNIVWTGANITFGHGTFRSIGDFVEHFKNKPLIGTESSQLVLLKVPYPRDVQEPDMYESVTVHAEFSTAEDKSDDINFSLNTKEGFLTKLGQYFKTWKTRWFVLRRNELRYYKEKGSKNPIRVLDLNECSECSEENEMHTDRTNVFKLVFRWRTFYVYATTRQDMIEWIKRINWCLEENQRQRRR